MPLIEHFFREFDAAWRWPAPEKLRLSVIGSAALMLQTNYERGTKDSDVLETLDLTSETKGRLLEVAGVHSKLHGRLRMYLDIVASGLPFLPHVPRWHRHAVSASLFHFDLYVLDVTDVVVSKLKRFSPSDASDVAQMIEQGLVSHQTLLARFGSALDVAMDFRGDEVPRYIRNLNRVERDQFGVEESSFELPSWADD